MKVEAMGMSSSLGPVVTAAAAFRAGIVRPRASVDVATFAQGDREPQPVTIYELPGATLGFSGIGRLVAIARGEGEALKPFLVFN